MYLFNEYIPVTSQIYRPLTKTAYFMCKNTYVLYDTLNKVLQCCDLGNAHIQYNKTKLTVSEI